MSRVTFTRLSDAPPPLRETLDVDADGSWRAWRSVGQAIGRFAGAGDAAAPGHRIVTLAEAATEIDPPGPGDASADTTWDTIEAGGTSLRVPYRATPEGAWGELLAACRGLLDDAITSPKAAIGMTLVAPDRVRLEHRGDEPLPVELGGATVEATVWTADGTFIASGTGRVAADHVDAGPGWTTDVELEGIDPSGGGQPVVFVSFVANDGGVFVPVVLSAGRAPG
jgi:hypothetical protein